MNVALFCCVVVLCCFALEKIRNFWLRCAAHNFMLFGSMIILYNIGFSTGGVMARDDVSRDLQEIITIVQDSSKTNTVQELRDKLEVMKAEIPSIVLNNNRIPMLKALRVIQ